MSTGKVNIQTNSSTIGSRFATLARMGEIVFHTRDAAVIWGITNVNTLYTTLSRYVRAGLLFRLQNGLYSIKPPRDLDPLLVGIKAIHGFCYVSAETVLARAGFINQQSSSITLVSAVSKQFTVAGYTFRSRRMADAYLFNEEGVERIGSISTATPARAVADMLYFNPRYHFDASAHIDWDAVKHIQAVVGYTLKKYKEI